MSLRLITANFFLVTILTLEANGATLHCEDHKDCAANACAPLCYTSYGDGGICGCAEENFNDLAHRLNKTFCVDVGDCAETVCTPICSSMDGNRGKCGCSLEELPEGEGNTVYCNQPEECPQSGSSCSPICDNGKCECQQSSPPYHRSSDFKENECNNDQDCEDKYVCQPSCNPGYASMGFCACKLQPKECGGQPRLAPGCPPPERPPGDSRP